MNRRRVVVTGMGIVSPLGSSLKSAWSNIQEGVSGIGLVSALDAPSSPARIAGLVRGFEVEKYLSQKDIRKTDPFIHYGVAAAKDAVVDAGLDITDANRDRIGVCVGSGIGGLGTIEEQCVKLHMKGMQRVSPFFIPSSIINMASGYISIDLGITGPNLAVATACTTGTHAIALGASLIRSGCADIFIVGGTEHASGQAGIAGFSQAKALSTRHDTPELASRPWDRDRDGFVLSDGAGVLVLEDLEHARRRRARIYAEFAGFGMSGDASHITLPAENGDGARRCMLAALHDSQLDAGDIDYINAHGTSTIAGDVAETVAVKRAFGYRAYDLAVSSTKSMTGHLLGAAGAVEAIFSVLALRDQVAPPTINLHVPGAGCDLDYVPHFARNMRIEAVMSNSFGFGGTNGTVIFKTLNELKW